MSRTDLGKKIKEGVEEAAKTAKSSAETVTKSGEKLGKTGAFKAISQVWHHQLWLNTALLYTVEQNISDCWFKDTD